MRSTFTTYLELNLLGQSGPRSEIELEIHYCHTPASGDGFHEQHWPEAVSIEKAVLVKGGVDLLDVLPTAVVKQLETQALELVHEGAFA